MTASGAPSASTAGGYGPPGGGYGGPPPGGPPPGGGGGGYGPPAGGPPGGYGGPPYGAPAPGYGYPPPAAPPGFAPPGYAPGPPSHHPLAIASLVLGLLSIPLCCCSFFGMWAPVAAVVCGIVGMNKIKAEPHLYVGDGMCIAGIVLGGFGLMLDLVGIFTSIGESLRNEYGGHL